MRSDIYFLPALGLLFIGLKLTHYIDWSWWWVLAPLWAPAVAGFAIFAGVFMFIAIVKGRK